MYVRVPAGFVVVLVAFCLVTDLAQTIFVPRASQHGGGHILTYTREYLLSLNIQHDTDTPAPAFIFDMTNTTRKDNNSNGSGNNNNKRRKKRGSRGGIQNRLKRRGCRLPLPAITFSNVRSLQNKMDEISALSKLDGNFRRSSLLCFTETWLNEDISNTDLTGYTCIRFDRDRKKTQKQVGGGLCMFVNNSWATNYTVRETVSSKHFEILTVSFRPHYLPREFGQITVILVYVPGPDNKLAAERIAESYNNAVSRSVDQPVFLLGDFNTCDMSQQLPHLHQYVSCPTRLNKTLDKSYGNISDAYISKCRPPLGRSDHNVIHLLPRYRQKLKTEKPKVQTIQQWTNDNTEKLRGCFEATDWKVFFDSCGNDFESLTDAITCYTKFCQDSVISSKTVRIFSNNKPWITKELKQCLNEKKMAFLQGDRQKVRELEKEFRAKLKKAKLDYKDKVERTFKYGNAREAWKGLNAMMGRKQKQQHVQSEDVLKFANDLNAFYARFDVRDFKPDCDRLCATLDPSPLTVTEEAVTACFSRVNPRKAPGPDGVKGRVLKECASQLSQVFTGLFQLFLNNQFVPRIWKTATITPVPKKTNATLLNDFRPISLTSVLCKCMERVVSNQLVTSVADRMDPFQFAYKAKRGVEDATLTLLNVISQHLDSSGSCVRILFMDLSSAFNTIQPHLLIKKLLDLQANHSIILWIRSFLCDRPQRVMLGGHLSEEVTLSTGAPQGCVLSPVLFSLYTNEITCNNTVLALIKYADDMALAARLKDENSLAQYFQFIKDLRTWFDESFLQLNIQKTKELICFSRGQGQDASLCEPLRIGNEPVEQVSQFKYLGTVLDQHLSFTENVDYIYKKAQQRLYLLRKLRNFNVDQKILENVYRSLIESVLVFNIVSWYGNLTVKSKAKLVRVVSLAGKIIGSKQIQLSDLYHQAVTRKSFDILLDKTHPLNSEFEMLPSGRRLKVPLARKNVYKKSFVPSAISILNSDYYKT